MDTLRLLDILGFAVGLVYLWLEYKASIWLWLAGIVMPAIDLFLYYKAGLYADFGLAVYYCIAGVYGFLAWKLFGRKGSAGDSGVDSGTVPATVSTADSGTAPAAVSTADSGTEPAVEKPVTRFPLRLILPALAAVGLLWAGIWWVLVSFTDSTVPVADAFTTALSIVALWALAKKYAEQWLLWLVLDLVCCVLYVRKGIPFKAAIYGLYTVVAVFGYRKWLRLVR